MYTTGPRHWIIGVWRRQDEPGVQSPFKLDSETCLVNVGIILWKRIISGDTSNIQIQGGMLRRPYGAIEVPDI